MATTRESYRLGARSSRSVTQLNPFAQGMYLTNQVIPEGYVKAMVNYDIDDTGSHIRPKRGRRYLQDILASDAVIDPKLPTKLGGTHLIDYLYCYNDTEDTVIGTEDLVISLGVYEDLSKYLPDTSVEINPDGLPTTVNWQNQVMVANITRNIDESQYDGDDVIYEGTKTTTVSKPSWCLRYNKATRAFETCAVNKELGVTSARVINNAHAFDKPFKSTVGRPVTTVLNNELYAFTGTDPYFNYYPNNLEKNNFGTLPKPKLSKVILKQNKDKSYVLKTKPIRVKELNPAEALNSGFNLLSGSSMFSFVNTASGSFNILGAIPYTDNNESFIPVFYPQIGQVLQLYIFYSYVEGSTFEYSIEQNNGNSMDNTFDIIQPWTEFKNPGVTNYLVFPYTVIYKNAHIRIKIRKKDDQASESVYPMSIRCLDTTDNSFHLDAKINFDLTTAKGMVSWLGSLGVYSIKGGENMMFFSNPEDPGYFPLPQNVLVFDNEILAVHNYLDNLLVITVDSIWLVVPGTSVSTSLQKKILTNIHIPEIDAINFVVLKDQIFFKTDDQFYVLKPNRFTSDATDLKNYLNSTAIANYTNNFTEETVKLLNRVFIGTTQNATQLTHKPIKFLDFDVLDSYSTIRGGEVHYIYKIKPILGYVETHKPIYLTGKQYDELLDLHLVYDSLTRSWRLYTTPIGNDQMAYTPKLYHNKQSGEHYEFFPIIASDNTARLVICEQTYDIVEESMIKAPQNMWFLSRLYNNYSYLDTGYLAIEDISTKRFREAQFALTNLDKSEIHFYTDFAIDGVEKVSATDYDVVQIDNPHDPDYGLVYVAPRECTNLILPGTTAVSYNRFMRDHWTLDFSKFPDLQMVNVRFELLGRGRRASLQLLSTSLRRYELATIAWVYRTMSAR